MKSSDRLVMSVEKVKNTLKTGAAYLYDLRIVAYGVQRV